MEITNIKTPRETNKSIKKVAGHIQISVVQKFIRFLISNNS